MEVIDGTVVSIHYTLTDESGTVAETTRDGDPMEYVHGHNSMIAGLVAGLSGRSTGERFELDVPPEQGFGPVDPTMIERVPREAFDAPDELSPGKEYNRRSKGVEAIWRLVSMDEQSVTVDGNHPLAGQMLHYDVEITAIRTATEEEMAQGVSHGIIPPDPQVS